MSQANLNKIDLFGIPGLFKSTTPPTPAGHPRQAETKPAVIKSASQGASHCASLTASDLTAVLVDSASAKVAVKKMSNKVRRATIHADPGNAPALTYEGRVLRVLYRFGVLDTQQIAYAIFADHGDPLRDAQRVLQKMVKDKLLRSARRQRAATVFTLSLAGMRMLRTRYASERKTEHVATVKLNAKDRPKSDAGGTHRLAANWVGLSLVRQPKFMNDLMRSERDLARNDCPFPLPALGRKPDALVCEVTTTYDHYTWVEVENSRRSTKSIESMANWLLREAFAPGAPARTRLDPRDGREGAVLVKVRFVISNEATVTFPKRLYRECLRVLRSLYPAVSAAETRAYLRAWAEGPLEFCYAPPYGTIEQLDEIAEGFPEYVLIDAEKRNA